MSTSYAWQLPAADAPCVSYRPGHQIHWIQFNKSMQEPGTVIAVTATVDDGGLVHLTGDGLSIVRWNHDPDRLRAALQRFEGSAVWKPRWYVLAVPTDLSMGCGRSVFSLAALEDRRDCAANRRTAGNTGGQVNS